MTTYRANLLSSNGRRNALLFGHRRDQTGSEHGRSSFRTGNAYQLKFCFDPLAADPAKINSNREGRCGFIFPDFWEQIVSVSLRSARNLQGG